MPATIHLDAHDQGDIERAAKILRAGGLVAFPTETVYGLGANALSAEAVARIFEAKQRPAWDPLIVHVPGVQELDPITEIPGELRSRVRALTDAFWPGPLTLLLPRAHVIQDVVTAGRSTVGVRVPSHPVAQALLRSAGVPIAAPSANRFGHVSPTTAQHVLDDLGGQIDAVLDGGPTLVGVESTVLDPAPHPMVLYRSGAVTAPMLAATAGVPVHVHAPVVQSTRPPESLPSPGVGMRHYAPDAEVILTGSTPQQLECEALRAVEAGGRVGILLPRDWPLEGADERLAIRPWGRWGDAEALASELFAALRGLESEGVSVMVCPLPEPGGGLMDAVRDRLLKAARPR